MVLTISVVRSSESTRTVVRRFTGGVVEHDVLQDQASAARDREAVRRIVLDIQILHDAVAEQLGDDEEVIRLLDAAVGSLTVPPSLSIAVNNRTWLGGDGDVGPADFDEVVVGLEELDCRCPGERDSRACLQL